jgi:DegV family protein with EDD domain
VSQRVAVVTDTTHYLPADLVQAHDLHVVSLYVNWRGRTERESELPGFAEYYDHLRATSEPPTTSQPSVGDFVDVYEPLLADGREVVSVHLSAALSGTCESARQAKARLEEEGKGGERVFVLDSASACGGEGFCVLAASAAARAGRSGEEVLAHAREAREHLRMWFALDTLEHLRRGGRVGAAQAWLGSTLKIKPILTVESEITPVERVRTSRRAFERMVDYMRSRRDDGADAWIVQHIQAPEEARRLIERGRDIFGTEPTYFSEVGPVIGTHVGPGLLGTGAVPSRYLEP